MEEETEQLHVVAFPWLAFGHMLPFLELSKRLAERGHAVSFLATPRNAARLPPVPARLAASVRVVSLALPEVEGLPEGAECTADVPPEKTELLKMAFDGLAGPFAAFLTASCGGGRNGKGFEKRPDWILLDFSHHWVWPIADEHKVACAMFFIVAAALLAFIGPERENQAYPRTEVEDYMVTPRWVPLPSTITYRRHEAKWIAGAFQTNASSMADMRRLWKAEQHSRLMIYRSCPEAELRLFPILTDLYKKPNIPAGLLLPYNVAEQSEDSSTGRSDIVEWLDKQPSKSVIYVALGSEAPLTLERVHELAWGLELSEVRFLWALRKLSGMFSADDGGTLLPKGFEERTRERGMVCLGWVPQVTVLAHTAVGAFLTHCGWGSTVESFRFGHPLVMLPFIVDQGLVARAMAERKIGVEVTRNEDDGSFNRDGIARAVRLVMVEEEGKVYASNAKQLQEVLTDRAQQERYFDELVNHLKRYKDDTC